MAPTRWGIISAGKICNDFCVGVATVMSPEEHQLVAVAARNLEAAKEFSKVHNIPNAYGSYEELVKDPNVGKYNNYVRQEALEVFNDI